FPARDGEAVSFDRQRGEHFVVELDATDRQLRQPASREVDAPASRRIRVTQRDAHAVAARDGLNAGKNGVEHLLELGRAQQELVDLAKRLEGTELLVEAGCAAVERT